MAVDLHISVDEIEKKVILRLEGRLDTASTPLLERKIDGLIQENRHYILLDFTRIDYLSSAGLRLLLSATKKLKTKKGMLLLFSLTEEADEVIKMAGFEKILHICPSEKEALHFEKPK